MKGRPAPSRIDGDLNRINSTGIIRGSSISINADNTRFDLASGSAQFVDMTDPENPVAKKASWSAQSSLTVTNLLTAPRTNIALSLTNSASPNVSYSNSFTATVNGVSQTVYIAEKSESDFDPKQTRQFARIGRLVHSNQTTLSNAVNLQWHSDSVLSSFTDFAELFSAINVEGNEFSGVALTASVQKTEGRGFRFGSNFIADPLNPNVQTQIAQNPTSHFYRYRDGSGGYSQSSLLSVLDADSYDDGTGTLQTVPNNKRYTVQPVWVFAGSGTIFLQYGQATYASQNAAIESISTARPALDKNLEEDAIFRGYFVLRKGLSDTTDAEEFQWVPPLGQSGGGSSAGVVVDLQAAFESSEDPEILTDAARGALTLRRGSALDSDNVLEIRNGAGVNTSTIDGDGNITALSIDINGTVVSDFQASVSSNTDVTANTAKVSADQSVTTHSDITSAGSGAIITTTERNKLNGIEVGAEVNNISDANATDLTDGGDSSLHYHSSDRSRANHTGTQAISTVTGLQTALDGKVAAVSSTNNAVSRFNGTAGQVQNSGVIINDDDTISASAPTSGSHLTTKTYVDNLAPVFVYASTTSTYTYDNSDTWRTIISTANVSLGAGDRVKLEASFTARLSYGGGNDDWEWRITCSNSALNGKTYFARPAERVEEHDNYVEMSYMDAKTVGANTSGIFSLQIRNTGDDGWQARYPTLFVTVFK